MRHWTNRSRRLFGLVVVLAGLWAANADAQTRAIDPYYVVVTGDHVYLRSGAGNAWYAVGYANTGDMLRVDGVDFGWVRVTYPETLPALVGVDDADLDAQRGVVVLNKPSRLTARNVHGSSLTESWKRLLPTALPPGAALKHLGALTNDTGQIEAYIVAPPNTARAFINEQFVRRATPGEITAWRAAQRAKQTLAQAPTRTPPAQPMKATPTAPVQAEASRAPADRTRPTPTEAPSAQEPAPSEPALAGAPTDSAAPDGAPIAKSPAQPALSPNQRDAAAPARSTPPAPSTRGERSGTATVAQPAATTAAAPTPTPAQANTDQPALSIENLEAAFRALAAQPVADAELDALIGEYRRFAATLPDTEENRLWRTLVDNRMALLEIRLDVQEQLRALEAANIEANRASDAIAARLAKLNRTRPFALVGRLTPSTLYDGQRLPLMYRLESVEAGAGRTIAYLVPSPDVDLNGKLGSIVGVEGSSRLDPALKLRIVSPTALVTLTPALSSAEESTPDQP